MTGKCPENLDSSDFKPLDVIPKPTPPRLSLRDIAKILGVSHSTVSMALRDHPRISEDVREMVKKKAAEVGYQPDPMLAALAHYSKGKATTPMTSAIGWINAWPHPEDLRAHQEFDCYWKGANLAAGKYGYRLDEFELNAKMSAKRLNQILTARGIRGLLLPPHRTLPDWGDFPWQNYSLVRFGRSLLHPQTHVVTADQVANTSLAFEKIRERGYRRIGFITNETDHRERGHLFEAGFLMAQRSLDEDERLPVFVTSRFSPADRQSAFEAWFRQYRPDALFTDSAEVPDMIKTAGLKIPDDVALAVTSVLDAKADAGIDQHPEEIGRVAFLMLNSLINDHAKGLPAIFRQILVSGTWVDGKSLPRRD